MKRLQKFASENKQTQGKFTIGDEKVSAEIALKQCLILVKFVLILTMQEHNVFMRLDVSSITDLP